VVQQFLTMSAGVNDIPILKRLTALEPEMELPPAVESPTLEVSESSGEEADVDTSDSESESGRDTQQELSVEALPITAPVGFRVEMPVWIWLSVLVLWIAYMWGIAYALTPVRTVYP
jgi:hypothetical protein